MNAAKNSSMKVPVTAVGFGIFVLGSAIFGQLRASYLRQASEKVCVEASQKVILRYAIWCYLVPVLCLVLSAFSAYDVSHHSNNQAREIIGAVCSLFMLIGGIFLFYRFGTGRVTIFEGKLTYTEGSDKREIYADDVFSFKFNGLSFMVKKKSERLAKISATFQHSEIILAFLKQAAVVK